MSPKPKKTAAAVPHPHAVRIIKVTNADTVLNDEQRARARAWLRANDIDPDNVAPVDVTIEERGALVLICFSEYYQRPDGQREINYHTNTAAQVQRTVPQVVPLDPDPLWLEYKAKKDKEKEAAS
jgi:hypothetical protein